MHLQTSLQKVPTTLPSVASGTKAGPLQVVQLPKRFTMQIYKLKRAVLAVSVYLTAQLSRENKIPSFQPC